MSQADSVAIGAILASQGLVNFGQFTGLALGSGLRASAQGNNLFLDSAADPVALQQASWRINAATGNDANSGLPGFPLKTFAELSRRWGNGNFLVPGAGLVVLVELETDLPSTDPISFDVRYGATNGILIKGLNTTVLYSGTFSAVTAKNRATNTPLQATDAGVPGGWGPFLAGGTTPARIHDTTNNSYFWPAKDLGAGAVRLSEPYQATVVGLPGNSFPNLSGGTGPNGRPPVAVAALDTFTLERLTQVYFGAVTINGATTVGATTSCTVAFQDLWITRTGGSNLMHIAGGAVATCFYGCLLGLTCNTTSQVNGFRFQNSNVGLGALATIVGGTGGEFQFLAGLSNARFLASMALVFVDHDAMFQGAGFGFVVGAAKFGNACFFDVGAGQSNNPTNDAIHLGPGTGFTNLNFFDGSHAIWGSGGVGGGIGVAPGATFGYQTNAPSVTGSAPGTNDFVLGGATSSRAWDEGLSAWGPLIANSWANLIVAVPAGLGNSAVNVGKGASISKGI
jgi:hypothetical protein